MSRSTLASRFRELVGVPIKGHITRLRMVQATALLEDPELTIAEIAFRTGYESVAPFHRAFSREIGTAPGEQKLKQASGAEAAKRGVVRYGTSLAPETPLLRHVEKGYSLVSS